MSTTLPVGATLADDADVRTAFEAFVRADGRRGGGYEEGDNVQSGTNVIINHDDDDADAHNADASRERPKMTARNVGDDTFGRRRASRAHVACDGTSGTCVGSDGTTGEATLGRLPVRARDGDASTSSSTRRVENTEPLKVGDAIWCGGEHAVATLVVMDDECGTDCVLATTRADGDATKDEVLYWRAGWREARSIAGLRGVQCICARFFRGNAKEEEEGVVRLLVGARDGRIFDARLDSREDSKRFEKSCDVVYATNDGSPVTGLLAVRSGKRVGDDAQETARYGVVFTTPSKMYALVGSYSVESVLAKARASLGSADPAVEMPVASDLSKLCVWRPRGADVPDRFAWLTGTGVYRGAFNFNASESSRVLERHGALPFPRLEGDESGTEVPISLTMTEYHILLLYTKYLVAMNAVTGEIEATIELPKGGASTFVFTDPVTGAVYVANVGNMLEVTLQHEDARMWRVYSDQYDYDRAIALCKSELQRQFVYTAKAERMLKLKRHVEAAEAYAMAGGAHSIEVVAKTLTDLGARKALYVYVETRLRELPSDDAALRLILAMWLLEQFVKIANASRSNANDAKVRDFLSAHAKTLDERETLRLLSDAKRIDDEMYFAELCGDYDRVLDHFIKLGNLKHALHVVSSPGIPRETLQRVLPTLLRASPKETVDLMLSNETWTDAMKIIQTFIEDASTFSETNKTLLTHILRYLETITSKPSGVAFGEKSVHNVLLDVYIKLLDTSPTVVSALNKYIFEAVDAAGNPHYDIQRAIRSCEASGVHRSTVYAYCVSKEFDSAIHIALQTLQDIELAKMVTTKAAALHEGDPKDDDVQKKLWIEIAKWSIQKSGALDKQMESVSQDEQRASIREALNFLDQTNGALRVEDILPLLPDFTVIDDVKSLVLKSLTEHRDEIEQLKKGIDDLNVFNQDVQDEIEELEQKTYVISKDQKCELCKRPVVRLRLMENADDPSLLAPFYVFPCQMAYHTECLMRRVLPLMFPQERERALSLMRALKIPLPRQLRPHTKLWGPPPKSATGLSRTEAVSELEDVLCSECPDCGLYDLRLINEPILTPEEQALDDELAALFPPPGNGKDPVEILIDFSKETPTQVVEMDKFREIKFPEDWPDPSFFELGDG